MFSGSPLVGFFLYVDYCHHLELSKARSYHQTQDYL